MVESLLLFEFIYFTQSSLKPSVYHLHTKNKASRVDTLQNFLAIHFFQLNWEITPQISHHENNSTSPRPSRHSSTSETQKLSCKYPWFDDA